MNSHRYMIAFVGSLFIYISFGILFFIISHFSYDNDNFIRKESKLHIILNLQQLQKSQPQNNPCCCSTKPKQEQPKTVSKNPTVFKKAKQISRPKQEKSLSISNKQSSSSSKQYTTSQEASDNAAPNKIDSSAFEAMIKNRIIQNKFYPLIAKNAGIEGVVNASFVILPNGNVGEISVSGPNALKSAAREAISRAFPIDARNCPVNLPITMHISLRYSLVE